MPTQNLYAVKDVHISNNSYGTYYSTQSGKSANLWLGCWDWDQYKTSYNFYAFQSRMLIKYDFLVLGPEDAVISAKLKVPLGWQVGLDNPNNMSSYHPTETFTIDVHKILQEWDEGVGDGFTANLQSTGATWTNRTSNGYSWSAYGGYIDNTPIASVTQGKNVSLWEFDITNLVKGWVASPSTNFGVLLKYRNDNIAAGSHYSWSKEAGNGKWGPYIEIAFNSPPEKPRGLVPNLGSFVCNDLAHTMEFKWNFIDTAAPIARGKSDIMFVVDVSSSMWWRFPFIKQQISSYIDRMTIENVDWQVGIVTFSDIRIGEPIRKFGWFTSKELLLAAFDTIPKYNGGDYPDSGLDAILDPVNGARSFSWRAQSQGQIMLCTDSPFHNKSGVDTYYLNGSIYEVNDAVSWMSTAGIKCSASTNTHCGSFTQLRLFPNGTGGQYYMNVISIRGPEEALRYDEGDYQTKADLRIFSVSATNVRTLIWSYTVTGSAQTLFVKGLGVPWIEGGAYEWDVVVYDKYGVPSPVSGRAPFTYIIDVNAAIGVPMFNEPLMQGTTVNKKALMEIRDKLYYELRKYNNLDSGAALTLFNGEVVPSKADMLKLKKLIDGMLVGDGLAPSRGDLIEDGFGVSDISYIRNRLVYASMSSPDTPQGGTAKKTNAIVQRPVSILSANDNATDKSIQVSWPASDVAPAGWVVDLKPATDKDINYYKLYHEQTIFYLDPSIAGGKKAKNILTEVYLSSEKILGGSIFIPDTGRADSESIVYRAHDMNGRVCAADGIVILDKTAAPILPPNSVPVPVIGYIVEYQQLHWGAIQSNPEGLWYLVYSGVGYNFTHNVTAEGSYWYRVKGIKAGGTTTGWTYSQNIVYVRN
jgi:hypothetical protein